MVLSASGGVATAAPNEASAAPAERRHASAHAIAEYVRARLADDAGDAKSAVEALRLALVHDPDSPQLRVSYATALARAGRLEAAAGEARRAIELAPGGAAAVDAHLALGKVLAATGRSAPAELELEMAARLESERATKLREERAGGEDDDPIVVDPEPWHALASLRLSRGDTDGAIAAGRALAEHDRPGGAAALREVAGKLLDAKDAARAEATIRISLDLVPSDGESWKLLANAEEDQERLVDARQALERALAADPADAEALLAAGQLALRQNDLAAARAWFRQLLRVAPDEALARLRVAATWLEARRPDDALEATSAEDQGELLYLRGVALIRLRRWSDAAAALDRIKPANRETYPYARASLAQALARAGKPQDAIDSLRAALREDPKSPVLLFAMSEAHDRAGDHDAALACMRAVLAIKPDHAEALNWLGYAYAERGERLEEAEALLRRALAIEPGNAYFLDSLGWVLFKRGDAGRAVETLERASALAGPEPTILDHLGDAYRAAHRPSDAAAVYRRALDAEDAEDEPGAALARRAAVQRKLDELGSREARPATATRR